MKKLLLTLMFCLLATTAFATDVTFQDGVSPTAGYSGTKDARIVLDGSTPTENYGAQDELDLSYMWSGNKFRILISFDLSSLSGVTSVTSATLSFYCYSGVIDAPGMTVATGRVLRNWGEGDNTGATADAGEVCWSSATATTQSWTTAGCDSEGNDRSALSSNVDGVATGNWISFDVTTDVNDILVNSTANYGWVIKETTTVSGRLQQYYSREHSTASLRPKLEITYSTSGGGSTPASTHRNSLIYKTRVK